MTCLLAKVTGQSISFKRLIDAGVEGFKNGIGKGDLAGLRTPDIAPFSNAQTQNFSGFLSDFNDTNQCHIKPKPQSGDITEEPYLCLGQFIHKGEVAGIVSKAGMGKTFLAIDIAKCLNLKKVVFFELDDHSPNQQGRFEGIPSLKLVSRQDWDQCLSALQADVTGNVTVQAILSTFIKPLAKIEQIKERRKKLLLEKGLDDTKKVDDILLWGLYMESDLCRDADAIILDCLNSLLDDTGRIIRSYLERITDFCKKNGKTLIILHHINKKGEITGSSAFSELMDTVLFLEMDNEILRIRVEKARYPQVSKGCSVRRISTGPQSVRFELCEETFQTSDSELPPLEKAILKVVGNNDKFAFTDLCTALKTDGFQNPGSIKNALKRLEDRSCLTKADGSSWDVIKNCRYEISEESPETGVVALAESAAAVSVLPTSIPSSTQPITLETVAKLSTVSEV
jgi:hypothetical protein